MKHLKKGLWMVLLTVVLLGAPMLARVITNLFDFSALDPDRAFLWITVRHILQALIVFVLVIVLSKTIKLDFNLGLGDRKVGFRYLKRFILFFSIYVVVVLLVTFSLGQFQAFQFPITAKNILGYLGFQLFLSGPSEEFIFRAFSMTVFAYFVSQKRVDKRLSFANLFSMVIFGLAHVAISFSPFGLSYALPQVFLAMGLGYFYGDCYEKSKSVLYPMMMHSFSNILMVGLTIILTALT